MDVWTVDELARQVGMTVRTIRYYATLGLIPAPERRGRIAYYDDRHRARLELVRTMQEQGLTLSSIEQHLARLHEDAPVAEIEMRRALVSSWAPVPPERVDRADLDQRAGRRLGDRDLALLEQLGSVTPVEGRYEVAPTFEVTLGLLDLDIPRESMEAAGEAIARHMDELFLELRDIFRAQVLAPLREQDIDPGEFARTMSRLQQLTSDALVANFQRSAARVVDGSLLGTTTAPSEERAG